MPVPALISDLNVLAANNSPSGSEAIGTNLDNYLRALGAFIAQLYAANGVFYCPTVGGTANAITLTTALSLSALSVGQEFSFFPTANNTGSTVQVNINGIGLQTVKKTLGNSLVDPALNDIVQNLPARLKWNGTNLILLNSSRDGQGADIASAGTVNLDTATGKYVDLTGTTAITAITLSQGRRQLVRFTGALTLTHGASLVLPSAANIVTAAGDYAEFVGYASGVVRCISYTRANGRPLLVSMADLRSAQLPAGVGASATSYGPGAQSSGTYTPDPLNGNFQHYTNNGAHTLAPPSNPCTIVLEIVNGATAGAITTSGFTKVNGDSMTTTNGHKFHLSIVKTPSYSSLTIVALQ